MKCPYCKYEHGWNNEEDKTIEGSEGGFYTLPVKMEKSENFYDITRVLYACPSCGQTFIEL